MHRRASVITALLAAVAGGAQPPDAPEIPLVQGLTVVTAVNNGTTDFESIKRIAAADATAVRVTITSDVPTPGGSTPVIRTRMVSRTDLEYARAYHWDFRQPEPEAYPGTTALGLSSAALRELERGETTVSVLVPEGTTSRFVTGVLRRVEKAAAPYRAIVNDEPASLPAIHARARFGSVPGEFWFLDQPGNPLALKWTIGTVSLQAVKISFPGPAGPSGVVGLEHRLDVDRRVLLYGIYFDLASDRLKPESNAVLGDIAAVLQRNPSWALRIEGHTDGLGSDAYNLALSNRRAAAVRQALIRTYHIDPARLEARGYGSSRPKETNDTLEGRARNRRVELVRLQ